jgi:hypothetical protein
MRENQTRVLLILSRDILDRARVVAGKATVAFKLPVSLQIVLRALLEEGLKRNTRAAFLANVESQARAVRETRSMARRGRIGAGQGSRRSRAAGRDERKPRRPRT